MGEALEASKNLRYIGTSYKIEPLTIYLFFKK